MSYSITSPPAVHISPSHSYLSGPDGIGAIWNSKEVRARVQRRRAERKATKKQTGKKFTLAILTGGLSLLPAIAKKKKPKKVLTAAPVSTESLRPETGAPTIQQQTSLLQQRAPRIKLPDATPFPWIAVGVSVGVVGLIGTILVLKR